MKFERYMHIERFGNEEVKDIELGECYVFFKLDGTNASVWLDDGIIKGGSRNRELTIENDNAGFYSYILKDERIKKYLKKHPNHRLYGEFLVKHSIKTYRDDAWNKFYIFDVALCKDDNTEEFLPYEVYKPLIEEFELEYVPPLAIVKNANYESFIKMLDKTGQFLVEDGKGNGEGIVIKNYDYVNKYGRQIWAKIVCNEFKELQTKQFGAPIVNSTDLIEEKIVNKFCTETFIEKEYQKIAIDGWKSQYISRLLQTIYYEFIKEESWNFIKEFKNPTINYKILQNMVTKKIKKVKKELFS